MNARDASAIARIAVKSHRSALFGVGNAVRMPVPRVVEAAGGWVRWSLALDGDGWEAGAGAEDCLADFVALAGATSDATFAEFAGRYGVLGFLPSGTVGWVDGGFPSLNRWGDAVLPWSAWPEGVDWFVEPWEGWRAYAANAFATIVLAEALRHDGPRIDASKTLAEAGLLCPRAGHPLAKDVPSRDAGAVPFPSVKRDPKAADLQSDPRTSPRYFTPSSSDPELSVATEYQRRLTRLGPHFIAANLRDDAQNRDGAPGLERRGEHGLIKGRNRTRSEQRRWLAQWVGRTWLKPAGLLPELRWECGDPSIGLSVGDPRSLPYPSGWPEKSLFPVLAAQLAVVVLFDEDVKRCCDCGIPFERPHSPRCSDCAHARKRKQNTEQVRKLRERQKAGQP